MRSAKNHAIFRLPQVVGKTTNPNALTNYLFSRIMSESHFQAWRHAKRNLIDIDHIALIVTHIIRASLGSGVTAEIAKPFSIFIQRLVSIFEDVMHRRANFTLVEAGDSNSFDATFASGTASQVGVVSDDQYPKNLIAKYYG